MFFPGLMVVVGIIIFASAITMDVTVETGSSLAPRVNNIGLMNDQRNYQMAGGFLALLGVAVAVWVNSQTASGNAHRARTPSRSRAPRTAIPQEPESTYSPEEQEDARFHLEALKSSVEASGVVTILSAADQKRLGVVLERQRPTYVEPAYIEASTEVKAKYPTTDPNTIYVDVKPGICRHYDDQGKYDCRQAQERYSMYCWRHGQ